MLYNKGLGAARKVRGGNRLNRRIGDVAGRQAGPNSRRYADFNVAIYTRAYEVQEMADLNWLDARFDVMQRHLKVGKVYLETHRDGVMPDEATIEGARAYLLDRGVEVGGGITYTVNERNRFQTYCYTQPESRAKVREIAEYTAKLFDDFILDDFFFTNCKCPACIEAKGARSWTEYRLQLMTAAAKDLVEGPARAANPDVRVIIKYPNWYEHFPALGFNLETQPAIFDGLYTGTETRDPEIGNQHLQPYESYEIFRYFEAIKPGANHGGWVDPFGSMTTDRYAEQLWLTAFSKAPEITLFDFRSIQGLIRQGQRAPWQEGRSEAPRNWGVGVDFDEMVSDHLQADGSLAEDATLALAAGHAFDLADGVVGQLGEPVGVLSYKPHHSMGEDFLHNYLGMLGIPIAMQPTFPSEAGTIFLSEAAKYDDDIVQRISRLVASGGNVVVTSGLYRALQGRAPGNAIEDIVELEVTDAKASVQDYQMGWFSSAHADMPITIPHIRYMTNDSWEEISGMTGSTGHPVLHSASYGNGKLYVLTIPDNLDDLYHLPAEVLGRIRETLSGDLAVRLEGPAKVCLFLYNNDTAIAESFLPEATEFALATGSDIRAIRDELTGDELVGEQVLDWRQRPTGVTRFSTKIGPHKFRLFRLERA